MYDAILTDWVDRSLKSLSKIEEERCIYDIFDALLKNGVEGLREKYQNRLDDYGNFLKSCYGYIVEVKSNQQNPKFNKENYQIKSIDYTKPQQIEGITLDDNIFRIKLLDSIGDQKNQKLVKYWFNSGLFHCLKHFSINGIDIAGNQNESQTSKKKPNLLFCEVVRFHVINGLYFTELQISEKKKNTFESCICWDDGSKCKAIFYLENNNNVYSLDTIIPQ